MSIYRNDNSITEKVIHQDLPAEINTIPTKTTPADADVFLLEDSADSFNKKSIPYLDLKADIAGGGGGSNAFTIRTVSSGGLTILPTDDFVVYDGAVNIITFVPLETTTSLPIGFRVYLQEFGTGNLQIQAEAGVTVTPTIAGGYNTTINETILLIKVAADSWRRVIL